jgi:cephalosporin hydroxylase
VNIPNVLEYFDKFTQAGDYIVVEDTHPEIQTRLGFGLLKEIEYTPIGNTWTMDPFKEFMKKHGSKYRVDPAYSDLNG